MKPLPFDMTPFAEAIEMPTTTQETKQTQAAIDSAIRFPRHIAQNAGWLSNLANEQMHALATHVLAQHSEHGLRTLAVTSALADEGKTTVTLALAEKLTSADKRVLVVDLDTHRSTLSHEAQIANQAGALESAAPHNGDLVPFHSYETDCDGVSIMPTGLVDVNTGAPLLDPERIKDLLKQATEAFDIVVLDCPPLLPVADTHVIGDVADRAILVVRANSTPRVILEQALQEFGKERFFAAILNRAQHYYIPYFHEVYGYYRRSSR
ncbi:MAG: CpsD/CapB family tyrosine-protein kinase [Planctomycetota bacterium]|jgi:capsular exopolysaccharide synthesis family protein